MTLSTCFEPVVLTFEPQLVERPWGGCRLSRYGKRCPPGKLIGESWEISDVVQKPSVVRGSAGARTLRDLMAVHAREILGAAYAPDHPEGGPQFPLLFKLLDAAQDLSIQVHPSDADLARAGIRSSGKTEAWIILDVEPGARVAHGLAPGVRREALLDRLEELDGERLPPGEDEEWFRWVQVEPGDVVFVPAGTIHAIGEGVRLLEVQQTSDVTYRLYDWGRVDPSTSQPRELHLAQTRGVTAAAPVQCPFFRLPKLVETGGFAPVITAADCDKFTIESVRLGAGRAAGTELQLRTQGEHGGVFHILTAYNGSARIQTDASDLELSPGVFALLPAVLGDYTVRTSSEAHVLRFASA